MAQIAHRELYFNVGTVSNAAAIIEKTIDLGESLSYVNRRMYEQGMVYALEEAELLIAPDASYIGKNNMTLLTMSTATLTWVTINAHVKAKALWKQMQDQVLEDNPSIKPKWSQFIVHLDSVQQAAGVGANLLPIDSSGAEPGAGEWDPATMVLPDWSIADTSDGFELHLIGDDVGSVAAGLTSGGIVKMYAETRGRVRETPTVDPDLADSWGIRLMDLGGQESELADVIEAENDIPPYDRDDYIGGDTSWDVPAIRDQLYANFMNLVDTTPGFDVPCGLMRVKVTNSLTGADDGTCIVLLKLKLAYGNYKGVAAREMRQ